MNASIRAHRILKALAKFSAFEDVQRWPSVSGQLGTPLGSYDAASTSPIWVYSDGLVWGTEPGTTSVLYREIAKVRLPVGKESGIILLNTKDGRDLELPISGIRGKFRDSLEFSRFIDRVIGDLKNSDH